MWTVALYVAGGAFSIGSLLTNILLVRSLGDLRVRQAEMSGELRGLREGLSVIERALVTALGQKAQP